LTPEEKEEYGMYLLEKAKEFCRREDQPLYTNANINVGFYLINSTLCIFRNSNLRIFRSLDIALVVVRRLNYTMAISVCELPYLVDAGISTINFRKCRSMSSKQKFDVGFCAGAADCPRLGLVKKIAIRYTGKRMCEYVTRFVELSFFFLAHAVIVSADKQKERPSVSLK
jgi:hypothetical protein